MEKKGLEISKIMALMCFQGSTLCSRCSLATSFLNLLLNVYSLYNFLSLSLI